jgi:hypothetical protein
LPINVLSDIKLFQISAATQYSLLSFGKSGDINITVGRLGNGGMEIMSEKAPSKVDTAATVAQRRDNALRRALSTPPKPKQESEKGNPTP